MRLLMIVAPNYPRAPWAAGLLASAGVAAMLLAGCVPATPGSGQDPSPTAPQAGPSATTRPFTSPPASAAAPPSNAIAPSPSPSPSSSPARAAAPIRPGLAVTTLATIIAKGRAPMTGYDRALFGQAWADVDRNGCDTRNDILRRDLTAYTIKAGTHGCVVVRGTLRDPYTGRVITFRRGPGTSTAVQIDHVVALGDAWQKGAQSWTSAVRTAFANDPLNLLAVDGPTNQRKGDGDAATWLPPLKASRCSYVARQVAVKKRYGLSVTAAERDAMLRVLQSCPGQGLPTPTSPGTRTPALTA